MYLKVLAFSSLTGLSLVASATILVKEVDGLDNELVKRYAKRTQAKFPENKIVTDMFELPVHGVPVRNLDAFIEAFVSSPLFKVERTVLKWAGAVTSNEEGTPSSYPVGQRIGIWEVTERSEDSKEAIFEWSTPLIPFSGSTYFGIRRDDVKDSVIVKVGAPKSEEDALFVPVLRFGSTLNTSPKESLGVVSLALHKLYSRFLLLAAAEMLKRTKP